MLTTMILRCCYRCRCLHRPWPTWLPRSCRSGPSLTLLFPALLRLQHCLLPAFLVVECPHHRSIASSCRQPLLAFITLPSMVGPCVHARFAICSPLPAFIIANVDAFVDGCRPFLLPIAIHFPLALIASRCLSLPLFSRWLVVAPLPASSSSNPFHHPLPNSIISRHRASVNAFVAGRCPLSRPITSHSCSPLLLSCQWLVVASSTLHYPPPTFLIVRSCNTTPLFYGRRHLRYVDRL